MPCLRMLLLTRKFDFVAILEISQAKMAAYCSEHGKRTSSTQRFVPMALQSTGGYCSNVSNFCRHPGLRTLELPSALRERLASPLDTMGSFLKLQLVMRVVKGTACNMVRLMERLCREYGEPEDHGGDD